MKVYSPSVCGCFAALAVVLCCGLSLRAATPFQAAPAGTPEVQALRGAYMTLYGADHDYHGHRIRAMHAIEKACDLLGTNIRGDGKGHETQTISDDQLKTAQQTIQQVSTGLAASQPKVVKHLDEAIAQLTLALQTK